MRALEIMDFQSDWASWKISSTRKEFLLEGQFAIKQVNFLQNRCFFKSIYPKSIIF